MNLDWRPFEVRNRARLGGAAGAAGRRPASGYRVAFDHEFDLSPRVRDVWFAFTRGRSVGTDTIRTFMTTAPNALLEWERAEIARSGIQARLSGRVRRTPPAVIARYANPAGDTPYAWEYAFHLLGDARGQRVLDLGCGDGECTTLVAAHGGRVAALDISTDLLSMTRERTLLDGASDAVAPLCGSVHSIPLASESVDIVFGMAVLHHVDLALAAAEVHRVLKPGGRAIFTEPIRNSRLLAAVRRLIPYRQPDISPFERPLRFDEIETFAQRFRGFERRVFDLPAVQLLRVCRANAGWQSWAYAQDAQLLQRWPRLSYFASVMVFQLTK